MSKIQLCLASLLIALCPNIVIACDSLDLLDGWVKKPLPGTNYTAAYFSIKNNGHKTQTINKFGSNQFAKVMIHWLITGLPILIASSLAAIILYLPLESFVPMILSLLLGTSFMSLLGALGAALSLGKSAILSAIIVLPFSIPTLLMGTSVVTFSLNNQDYSGFLMMMGAMLAIGIPLLCLLTVEALLLNYD